MIQPAPIIGISRHRIPTDGDGVTTLVAFGRCPLHCKWCLNPQCHRKPSRSVTPEELLDIVAVDDIYFQATGGGICFGGGEPALRSRFIARFRKIAPQPWHIYIETSLAVATSHMRELLPVIDHWIIDVKDMHPATYLGYTKRPIDALLANLKILADAGLQDRCTLRIPLIPDFNSPQMQLESREALAKMGFNDFDLFNYKIK